MFPIGIKYIPTFKIFTFYVRFNKKKISNIKVYVTQYISNTFLFELAIE
jgi:hypothetical protein